MQSRGTTFIAFIELVFDTSWMELPLEERENYVEEKQLSRFLSKDWAFFKTDRSAEIELLEPEVKRRSMQFRRNTIVAVRNNIVRYQDADYEHELTIDENQEWRKTSIRRQLAGR